MPGNINRTGDAAPCTLPDTNALLVSGGDARIALDPVSRLSVYGGRPCPDPDLVALGSSTASVISSAGMAAADAPRQTLQRWTGSASWPLNCWLQSERLIKKATPRYRISGAWLVDGPSGRGGLKCAA